MWGESEEEIQEQKPMIHKKRPRRRKSFCGRSEAKTMRRGVRNNNNKIAKKNKMEDKIKEKKKKKTLSFFHLLAVLHKYLGWHYL
jgi:hypothetical protein